MNTKEQLFFDRLNPSETFIQVVEDFIAKGYMGKIADNGDLYVYDNSTLIGTINVETGEYVTTSSET